MLRWVRPLLSEAARLPCQTMADERKVVVTLSDIELKLTLTNKLLKKPFDQAVLNPFLKVYSKRTDSPRVLTSQDVSRVMLDDVMMGDLTIPASVVLLKGETVYTEIFLRSKESASTYASTICDDPFSGLDPFAVAAARAPPAAAASARLPPAAGTVEFDGKSEVERLKDQRRAARLAREVSAPASARTWARGLGGRRGGWMRCVSE